MTSLPSPNRSLPVATLRLSRSLFLYRYLFEIHRALFPSSLIVIAKRAVQRVIQDIAQRQQALELARLVDDDESVDARLADRIEDGVEAVVEGACVDAWKVLSTTSASF